MPDIAIRTTLITGFPGESSEQHEQLRQFLEEMRYDRVGIFAYSQEKGTPAALMPDQISEEIKESRREDLYQTQQAIVFDQNRRLIGSSLKCLIEGELSDEPGVYAGRTYRDAPDVDGLIFVKSSRALVSGMMVDVCVTGASGYDLTGEEIC